MKYQVYAEYKDSGVEWIGDIPQCWHVKPLYGVADTESIKNEDGIETNVLSLSYGNIIRRDVDKNFGLLPESFNTYQLVNFGDLILRLTDLQNDKRSLRVGHAKEKGIITSAYLKLVSKRNKLNDSFLYRLLHSYDTTKVFYGMGGGLRQSMKFEEMRRLPILIPSLDEQEKIVNFLDHETAKIDTLIEKQQQLVKLLKEKRQAVISHAVTKGLNPNVPMRDSGVEWLGEVPEHWAVKRVKHFGKIIGGYAFKSGDFSDRGVRAIKIANVSHLAFDWSDSSYLPENFIDGHKEYIPPKESLVFAMTRPIISGGVKVAKFELNEPCLVNQRVGFLKPSLRIKQDYLMYVAQSKSFFCAFENNITATNQPNISAEGIEDIRFACPELKEQIEIINHIKRVSNLIEKTVDRVISQVDLLKERRIALIFATVTGKIDVRNWQPPEVNNKEVAL